MKRPTKRSLLIFSALLAATCAAMAATDSWPRRGRTDATTIRPEIEIDPSGGELRIHGFFRIVNPDARDHTVMVRLTVSTIEGQELHSEDLSKIDYHRNHPRDFLYPVHGRWGLDIAGLVLKVAAVDSDTGHEFCSVVAR
jgi:hypothetical protein